MAELKADHAEGRAWKTIIVGETFEKGKLDEVLEHSEDLRNTVLELLCAIGNTIIRGKS